MAQPTIEPVPDDGATAIRVGLVLWSLATLACIVRREELEARGSLWWLWTCLAGLAIGVFMLFLLQARGRRSSLRQAVADEAASPPSAG